MISFNSTLVKIKVFFIIILMPSIALTQEETQGIKLIKEIGMDTVSYHLVNNYYAPITVSIKPKDSYKDKISTIGNYVMRKRDTLKKTIEIPRNFVKDTGTVNYSEFATLEGNLGDVNLKPNLKHLYSLPFEKGKAYQIMQPNFGSLSHNKKTSFYAFDFQMEIGTPIHAARSGIVIKTQDKYTENGGVELKYKANTIAIFHDDGTIAHYDHLKYKGVFVKPGDFIEKGEYIGLSGFTGYSTKPHLHFVVQNGKNEAIPIYFKGYKNKTLKEGKVYKNKK